MAAMRFWTPLLLATIVIACKASDTGDTEGQGAAASGGRCVVMNQITGSPLTQDELAKIDDPIARLILSTDGCPQTVSQLAEKLRTTDTKSCADQGKDKAASGVTTRMIGEGPAASGKPGSYRTVTTRDCDGRPPFGLLMSGTANGSGIGEDFLEIITQDKTKGVFDYYSQEGGQWTFFGTSADFVSSGYTCKSGQCTPKIASKTRCAGCHPGGGLNMKELESPWVQWDVGSLAGAPEAIAKTPAVLGSRGSGVDLQEQRVEPGNQAWNRKRLEILKPKGTQEVLRPLFCTVAMNLQTSSSQKEGLTSVAADFFVDRTFGGNQLSIDNADYKALLTSSQSTLPGGNKDTPFSFAYPRRSNEDLDFQQVILSANIVDDDFVKDVLNIDFTRPAYSAARCDLLKLAPTLTADKMTAEAIREGFKTSLKGQTGAAAVQLLANLNAAGDQQAHQAEVTAFFTACAARPKKDLLTDVMTWASHLRKTVRSTSGIIEFDGSLPKDNLPDTTSAFDKKTCVLGK
jgi:hypothetical protein